MSGSVIVTENGQGRYQQAVTIGQHHLIADEPVSVGGADAGPAPIEFIMSGLGACTAMTLRMYAERKELALTNVHVELTHRKEEIDGVQRDRIDRKITLSGNLTAEQRQRMLEIANKCPMHRTLSQSILLECVLSTS